MSDHIHFNNGRSQSEWICQNMWSTHWSVRCNTRILLTSLQWSHHPKCSGLWTVFWGFFLDRQLTIGGFAKILLHASIKTVRCNYLGGSRYTTLYPERGRVFPLGITWCSTDWGLHLSYWPWSCASFTFGSLLGCLAPFFCWGGSHISFDKQASHRYVVSLQIIPTPGNASSPSWFVLLLWNPPPSAAPEGSGQLGTEGWKCCFHPSPHRFFSTCFCLLCSGSLRAAELLPPLSSFRALGRTGQALGQVRKGVNDGPFLVKM